MYRITRLMSYAACGSIWNGGRPSIHQLRKAWVFAKRYELGVLIDVVDVFVAFFHRLAKVKKGSFCNSHLGVELSDNVVIVSSVFRLGHLGRDSSVGGSFKHIRIELQRFRISEHRAIEILFGKVGSSHVAEVGGSVF